MITKIPEAKENIKKALSPILNSEEMAKWIIEGQNSEKIRQSFDKKCITLLSFDVDKIKDLVFASAKPLEIQGASEIVKDLTLDEKPEGRDGIPACSVYSILKDFGLHKWNVLFAGGGTGTLIIPSDKALGIAEKIKNRFAEDSITGSCSVIYQEFFPHELITGPEPTHIKKDILPSGVFLASDDGKKKMEFGRIIQFLADQLREEKEYRLIPKFNIMPGYVHICDSCSVREATCSDSEDLLCESCYKHRVRGREEKERLKKYHKFLETAQDINEIADTEERGYMAIIHADANGMGQKLFKLEAMEEYVIFSQAVKRIMENVTKYLITKPEFDLTKHYQSPVIGGDDILMIVPADKARAIVSELLKQVKSGFKTEAEQIEDKASELYKRLKDITMSVGFVIVPSHFNIRFSVDYAEELLKTAKSKRHEKGNDDYIDWMVIKEGSPLSLGVKSLRESVLVREIPSTLYSQKINLTNKPFTIEEFDEISRRVKKLKEHGISNQQLRHLQTLLERESPSVIKLNTYYQWLRVPGWKNLFQNGENVDQQYKEWYKFVLHETSCGSNIFNTNFIDMMELYEFEEGQ